MARALTVHSHAIKEWLEGFFDLADEGRVKRGIALYENGGVWDYHVSRTGCHALVEGHYESDYQVDVLWDAQARLKKEGVYLPYPIHDLRAGCSCPDNQIFCKHVIAVVIYWMMDKDKRLLEKPETLSRADRKTQSALRAGQEKLNAFRRLSGQKLPSFTRFHSKSLITAPDIHSSIQKASYEVLRWAKDNPFK